MPAAFFYWSLEPCRPQGAAPLRSWWEPRVNTRSCCWTMRWRAVYARCQPPRCRVPPSYTQAGVKSPGRILSTALLSKLFHEWTFIGVPSIWSTHTQKISGDSLHAKSRLDLVRRRLAQFISGTWHASEHSHPMSRVLATCCCRAWSTTQAIPFSPRSSIPTRYTPDLIKAISKLADIDKVPTSGPGSHVVLMCLPQWCAQSRHDETVWRC